MMLSIPINKAGYILIAIAVVALMVLNYCHFADGISSNDEFVTDFVIKEDRLEKYRNPRLISIFYAGKVPKVLIAPSIANLPPKINVYTLVEIVPNGQNPQDLAEMFLPYTQKDKTIVVAETDLSTYTGGSDAVNAALILVQKLRLRPEMQPLIVKKTTPPPAPKNGIAKEMDNLKAFVEVYRQDIIGISRIALNEALQNRIYKPARADYDEMMFNKGAVFVSLLKDGQAVGESGSIMPTQAVAVDIANNTRAAVGKEANVAIEVSILTGFEKIDFKDEADLLAKLEPDIDGVVLRDGYRQALFLPNMWERHPNREEFLQRLKIKAGLNPTYWSNDINIYRFYTVKIRE